MIARVLARVRMALRRAFRQKSLMVEEECTPEEKAEIMDALNPAYRLYVRDESGRIMDVALDEDGQEIGVGKRTREP